MSDSRIDQRAEALGVFILNTPNAIYPCTKLGYDDPTQAQGRHNIYFTVLDEKGSPLGGVDCWLDWNGRDATPKGDPPTHVVTDANGQANVGIYANLDIHKLNGPYFCYVGNMTVVKNVVISPFVSDVPSGMGLPEHNHVDFYPTFQKGGVVPPPPPPPTDKWQITNAAIPAQDDTHIALVISLEKKA